MAKPSSVELERQSLAELKRDVIEHIEEVTLDQAMEEALLEHAARIKFEKERLAKEKKERDEAEAKRSAEKVYCNVKRTSLTRCTHLRVGCSRAKETCRGTTTRCSTEARCRKDCG